MSKHYPSCKELGIDILIDDFIGYVAVEGAPVRLLVMPDATKPYYDPNWKTDGSEGDFGRRTSTLPHVQNPMKSFGGQS